MISKAIYLFTEQKWLSACLWEADITLYVVSQHMNNSVNSAIPVFSMSPLQ